MKAILGKKVGMTQIFSESGEIIPVTVIEAGPAVVTQIKTVETDGYYGVQIGFEDRTFTYYNDSIVIIPPMVTHSNWSDSGFTNIHVNIVDSTLNFREPIILSCTSNAFLRQAFEAAFYYYSNNGIGRTTLLPVYGQLIASTALMLASDIAHSDVVQQVINDILKNYPDADYDLNAYLQSMPFSFEYLKKMFKNEVGMTPRQYLTDKRLENAANNLALSGCGSSISQIARQSGFQEPLYFSRLFTKIIL